MISVRFNLEELSDELDKVIESAICETNPEIILVLIQILRRYGKKGLDILLEFSLSEDSLLALASVMALGEVKDPIIYNHLKKISESDAVNNLVRESALDNLGNFSH